MRRAIGVSAEPVLGLREHGQCLAVGVIVQPWRSDEQGAGVLEAARLNFGLRPFDDQECVGIGLAFGCGEQGLSRMPGSAG